MTARACVVVTIITCLTVALAAPAAAAPLRYRLRNDGQTLVAIRGGVVVARANTADPAPPFPEATYPFAVAGKSNLGGTRTREAFLAYPFGASSVTIGIYSLERGELKRVKSRPQVPFWDGALFHGASFVCRRFARGPGLVQRVFSAAPGDDVWKVRRTRYLYADGRLRFVGASTSTIRGPEDSSHPRLRRLMRNDCPGVRRSF